MLFQQLNLYHNFNACHWYWLQGNALKLAIYEKIHLAMLYTNIYTKRFQVLQLKRYRSTYIDVFVIVTTQAFCIAMATILLCLVVIM